MNIKTTTWGASLWRSGWDLPANAGHTGSSPGLGRSHMPRSNWAREPQLLSLRVWSLCSATRETTIVRGLRTAMKSGPRLPQLEKALAQKRRPNTAKKNKNKNKQTKKTTTWSYCRPYRISELTDQDEELCERITRNVRAGISFGGERANTDLRENVGSFWVTDNVLFLDLCGS